MNVEEITRLSRCIHCGLCLQACPTYRALGTEMDAPRGRIAMLRSVQEGRFPLSDSLSRHLYQCIGCEACRVSCPSGVQSGEIFASAKRTLAAQFLPEPLAQLEERILTTHNVAGEPAEHRLLWTENLDTAEPPTKPQAEVALFTGCVAALYPMVYGLLGSLVQVLRAAKVDFSTLGPEEWCCGYPLISAGRPASELMAHNVARIEAMGARTLVTACPSCYHTWHAYYAPQSFRVLHATEFLLELIEAGRLPLRPLSLRVTYHDPCDLGRKSNIYDAPRRILQAIPGLSFTEMKMNRENALCCGGGGNLESVNVSLSRAIAHLRLEQAVEAQAEVLVSACQQCERTLAMAARRESLRLKVMDLTQLLALAL